MEGSWLERTAMVRLVGDEVDWVELRVNLLLLESILSSMEILQKAEVGYSGVLLIPDDTQSFHVYHEVGNTPWLQCDFGMTYECKLMVPVMMMVLESFAHDGRCMVHIILASTAMVPKALG